ncbi:hypothetical protein ACIBF1_08035 [Spirillospora sp. NPDC050679]
MIWSVLFFGVFLLLGLAVLAGSLLIAITDGGRAATYVAAAFGAFMTLFFGGIIVYLLVADESDEEKSKVDRDRAESCTLRILRVQDTGSTTSRRTVYRFKVRVSIPGKADYEADSVMATSNYDVARVAAGHRDYACLVDRDDPQRVQILWNDSAD